MTDERRALLPLVAPEQISANLTGNILNIHRITAHSPKLLEASAPLRNYLVKESALTDRQRELIILRAAHIVQSDYEWSHHIVRGRAAGLSDEEIARVRAGADADGWAQEEAPLLRAVDEICAGQILSTETARRLLSHIGADGVIDAVFTIGYYIALGTLLKTFAVPLDETITTL